MRKYRRNNRKKTSVLQAYQVTLMACGMSFAFLILAIIISHFVSTNELFSPMTNFFHSLIKLLGSACFVSLVLFIIFNSQREQVSTFEVPEMSASAKKLSRKILRLFNDKQVTDVLKLSNPTRFGDEMPLIYVWLDDECTNGFIAVENIGNFERMDREKFEQRISGILGGKYKRIAVVSSELSAGDVYMLFFIEDTLTSQRLHVNNANQSLNEFVSEDAHSICLSKDLVWHTDIAPHISIIARTRSGKSMFVGSYIIPLMKKQGWVVEYNSAKLDKYVKEFDGQHEAEKIVKRTEYWVLVMKERLALINEAGKDKYLDMNNMPDIAIVFDELGDLNAELELNKELKKRWETSINKLTATGGSPGIHVIAISQFATKEGFLPSLARVNCSDAVIMLGGAADSGDERRYLMAGFADLPKRSYGKGQGIARIVGSGRKWENSPHFYETPWFD